MHDEAEIRGHRRTYIGAMPGNIIQAIRKAGARELRHDARRDRQARRRHPGRPAAALLEVLDPEQNNTFRDNYLGVPFDLSRVRVHRHGQHARHHPRAAARPHGDHQLAGYTEEREAADRQALSRHAASSRRTVCKPEQAEIDDEALREIIARYTREAGVRNLEREIGTRRSRNAAVEIAEGKRERVHGSTPTDLAAILGPPRFENEVAMRTSVPGVATGLAWTPVGGDILFIEATRMPGTGG